MNWSFRRPVSQIPDEEVQGIAYLYGIKAWPVDRIAKVFRRDPGRVAQTMRQIGVIRPETRRRSIDPVTMLEVAQRYVRGTPIARLAKYYRLPATRIRSGLERSGVAVRLSHPPVPKRTYTPAQRNEMAMLYEDYSWSVRRLSESFGGSLARVTAELELMGVVLRKPGNNARPRRGNRCYRWQWYGDDAVQKALRFKHGQVA